MWALAGSPTLTFPFQTTSDKVLIDTPLSCPICQKSHAEDVELAFSKQRSKKGNKRTAVRGEGMFQKLTRKRKVRPFRQAELS